MDRADNYFSSDSTSSSESFFSYTDESKSRRKHPRIENYVEKTVKEYNDKEFKSHFRVSRKTCYELISMRIHIFYMLNA